jgi:hypothetical protein
MTEPIDDILLTAFALGELDDAEQCAHIERHLASDAAAAQHVAEVQATAEMLTDGFIAAPDVGLTAIQYAGIERRLAADAAVDAPHSLPFRRNWGLWGSVAASTLIVATVMATVMPKLWQSMPGTGGGKGAGAPGSANKDGDAGQTPVTSFPVRPMESPGAGGDGIAAAPIIDSSDWPILRTSAGGLPWPAIIAPDTRLREPAFVVAGDFPLAVIPPTPSYPQAADRKPLAALKTAIDAGRLPSPQSIRTDELINAVRYDDAPEPHGPVSATIESAVCPWDSGHLLVRVTVRTTGRNAADVPAAAEAEASPVPSLVPLVRDLRLSVEVNPAAAAGYRVIGYENAPVSWGEWAGRTDNEVMPPGRTFTALLEVVPTGQALPTSSAPAALKYRKPGPVVVTSTELLTVAVEYGQGPTAAAARIDLPISVDARAIELASPEFRTAAAAAALGMALRHSQPYNEPTLDAAVKLLGDVTATEPTEDRQMLLDLARRVEKMNPNPKSETPMPGPFEQDEPTEP